MCLCGVAPRSCECPRGVGCDFAECTASEGTECLRRAWLQGAARSGPLADRDSYGVCNMLVFGAPSLRCGQTIDSRCISVAVNELKKMTFFLSITHPMVS